MVKIRKGQVEAFEAAMEGNLRHEFASRLRKMYPEKITELGEKELASVIDGGLEDAHSLEILQPEDAFRFINLKFLLGEKMEAPLFQSVLLRVLNNTDIDGTKRLDFIYRQLPSRAVPPNGSISIEPAPTSELVQQFMARGKDSEA